MTDFSEKVFLSTGSLVGRVNNYNYNEISNTVIPLMEEGFIDGAEFMFITLYYEIAEKIAKRFISEGIKFPVLHLDKDIGTLFSDAAVMMTKGEKYEAIKTKNKALDMFKFNCETACATESERLVLHLWGGLNSDIAVDYNVKWLDELLPIAESYNLKILCENIPSVDTDPLTNWHKLTHRFDRIGLVFDTRFATCHRQPKETLTDMTVFPSIEHVHISDYRGGLKEFKCLRPVFHPGEGIADFELMFGLLKKNGYNGSFTLESPGIVGGTEVNIELLKKSIEFIKNNR